MVYREVVNYIPKWGDRYDEMVRCYVDRKGQYRRPSYVLLWNILFGGLLEDALLPAAAQQISEDWILMHDDWMDSNRLRRGGPAAHVLFGDKNAVNAADGLQVLNWRVVKDAADRLGGDRGRRYFDKFCDMMLVTTYGQYLDLRLTHEVRDITMFTPEDYYESTHAKSAYYSVYGPMQCGAIVAGVGQEVIERIPEYGIPAGKAFQIIDDVLDCISTPDVLGKSIGHDILDGTKTLILWHAAQNASSATLASLDRIYRKQREEKTEKDVNYVLDIFNELESIRFAQNEAKRLVDEATRAFDMALDQVPDSHTKDLARESITYTATRKV